MNDFNNRGCLHLVMSPHAPILRDCLSHCLPGDCVVLVDNAVSLLMQENLWMEENEHALPGDQSARSSEIQIFALEADVLARGIPGEMLTAVTPPFTALIDDVNWAGLLIKYPHCLSWK